MRTCNVRYSAVFPRARPRWNYFYRSGLYIELCAVLHELRRRRSSVLVPSGHVRARSVSVTSQTGRHQINRDSRSVQPDTTNLPRLMEFRRSPALYLSPPPALIMPRKLCLCQQTCFFPRTMPGYPIKNAVLFGAWCAWLYSFILILRLINLLRLYVNFPTALVCSSYLL